MRVLINVLLQLSGSEKMISNAGAKDIEFNKLRCGSCGHSWLRREGVKADTCPACGSSYIEDERRNIDRKN
jgi:predicted Zn-ribbon and HTH transcriptional regulator